MIKIFPRQGIDPLFKYLDPPLKEESHQTKTASQQYEAGGQNDLKPKTTKSNSSMTSFAELVNSEDSDTASVVEKLNKEHTSIISSLTSLNRFILENYHKIQYKLTTRGEEVYLGESRDLKPHLCKIFANPFIASQLLVKSILRYRI